GGTTVLVGVRVLVGGTAVRVALGGIAVLVGVRDAVGGTAVLVGVPGAGELVRVAVAGTGVLVGVGGVRVAVGVSLVAVAVGATAHCALAVDWAMMMSPVKAPMPARAKELSVLGRALRVIPVAVGGV